MKLTDAEMKVWKLYSNEVRDKVIEDFEANAHTYEDNVTLSIMMLEQIAFSVSLQWRMKLKSQSSYNIPSSSVDEFVNIMEFNVIRKLKNILFE
ncbi:MAG TPA: hypothetical protein GXZ87_00860 [Bacteroidales bacterium]|nr:hypothetical protein [Bacteroidales bacterium]